jgi:hypothetical protein
VPFNVAVALRRTPYQPLTRTLSSGALSISRP